MYLLFIWKVLSISEFLFLRLEPGRVKTLKNRSQENPTKNQKPAIQKHGEQRAGMMMYIICCCLFAHLSDSSNSMFYFHQLSESRVFQAQNVQMPVQPVTGNMPDRVPSQNAVDASSNHLPNTAPQMGDRIDLGTLFKKSGNAFLYALDKCSHCFYCYCITLLVI